MSSFVPELLAAEAIARRAGQHILRERSTIEVSLKSHNDLVTNVDRSTERLIVDYLTTRFPGDRIVGEEFGEQKPERNSPSNRTWLIDPIDGTLNFATDIPLYCVSIGLEIDDQATVGVIYDPTRDELFSAARNQGAHLNGETLQISDADALSQAVLVTGFPYEQSAEFEWTMKQFSFMTRNARGIRRLGSAALNLAYVAAGRMDGFWQYGLKPWDTAAGHLMVSEAGGKVSDLNGQPFSVDGPSLLATNSILHTDILRVLQSHTT